MEYVIDRKMFRDTLLIYRVRQIRPNERHILWNRDATGHVIDSDNVYVGAEPATEVRPDETRAARDEDFHKE